jgi:hypothetical protein
LVQLRAGGLVIGNDPFLTAHVQQLGALTLRHAVPAIFQYREFTAAGGLMSYGGGLAGSYRLVGVYTGRILKGDKPADLPVQLIHPTGSSLMVARIEKARAAATGPNSFAKLNAAAHTPTQYARKSSVNENTPPSQYCLFNVTFRVGS